MHDALSGVAVDLFDPDSEDSTIGHATDVINKIQSNTPDPNITGPCEIQSSPFCDGQGRQRLNPTDMLQNATAFRAYAPICQPCYDHQCDVYLERTHA